MWSILNLQVVTHHQVTATENVLNVKQHERKQKSCAEKLAPVHRVRPDLAVGELHVDMVRHDYPWKYQAQRARATHTLSSPNSVAAPRAIPDDENC